MRARGGNTKHGYMRRVWATHSAIAAHGTFETVKAGLHCSFRISRHMLPLELMLGWYTFVAKLTCHQAHVDVRLEVCVELQA